LASGFGYAIRTRPVRTSDPPDKLHAPFTELAPFSTLSNPFLMPMSTSPIRLPHRLQQLVEACAREYLHPDGAPSIDFSLPLHEPAFNSADSLSWRIFKNPVALFIGGITAVILELAEPRVCAGVWEHTRFREFPLHRLRNTGFAAMVTVYGPQSEARKMISHIRQRHERIAGVTADGVAYRANDPELLDWVYATASFGFMEAYHAYVHALAEKERDSYYAEAMPAAYLYGASGAPDSQQGLEELLALTAPRLNASAALFEFLEIMQRRRLLPGHLFRLQPMLVRAAVELVPAALREKLGLGMAWRLHRWQRSLLQRAAGFADRLVIAEAPAAQSCRRLGLPEDFLYRARK
jgi:uncharacterized protein (DUF2236 family)